MSTFAKILALFDSCACACSIGLLGSDLVEVEACKAVVGAACNCLGDCNQAQIVGTSASRRKMIFNISMMRLFKS